RIFDRLTMTKQCQKGTSRASDGFPQRFAFTGLIFGECPNHLSQIQADALSTPVRPDEATKRLASAPSLPWDRLSTLNMRRSFLHKCQRREPAAGDVRFVSE